MKEYTSPSVTPNTPVATNQATKPFIFFDLAGTTWMRHLVQQIEMVEHITPVPNAPAFVDGVVFARGQVVTVVNLRSRFGFDRVPIDLHTRLMVMAIPGRSLGLLVDSAQIHHVGGRFDITAAGGDRGIKRKVFGRHRKC